MTAPNRLRITFADNTTLDVQTTLEDRLAFETALRKNKSWGQIADNPMKLHPFLAWNAARRTGKTDLDWHAFTTGETAALDVSPIEDDDELEVEGVGKDTPTEDSSTSPSLSPVTTAELPGNGEASPVHV